MDEIITTGGKWEDDEERRFYEDVQDLKDFVPSSVLGIDVPAQEEHKETAEQRLDREEEEVKKLEEELHKLEQNVIEPTSKSSSVDSIDEDE